MNTNSIDEITNNPTNRKEATKPSSMDIKRVKTYTGLAHAISCGDWKIATRYFKKISTDVKYQTLPGVSASERTRINTLLGNLVENKQKADVKVSLNSEGKIIYNI